MKYHVFLGQVKGRDENKELICFDADEYTEEAARNQFTEIPTDVLKNNHWVPFTFLEYDGQVYYKVYYHGVHDDSETLPFMSRSIREVMQ